VQFIFDVMFAQLLGRILAVVLLLVLFIPAMFLGEQAEIAAGWIVLIAAAATVICVIVRILAEPFIQARARRRWKEQWVKDGGLPWD
jgi:hypothetical protein